MCVTAGGPKTHHPGAMQSSHSTTRSVASQPEDGGTVPPPAGMVGRAWAARLRFQIRSRTTDSSAIATMAMKVAGSLRSGVDGEEDEHDRGHGDGSQDDRASRSGVGAASVAGDADEQEDEQRAGAADRGDRREVDGVGDDEHDRAGDQQPGVRAEPRARSEQRWELPDLGQLGGQPGGGVERRVDRGRRGQQGGDRHHHEARLAECRAGGLGDRGLAVALDLLDGERAEHAECDQHVGRGRHAERDVHRLRELARRVAKVADRERDHAEAEVGEERQRDAGDDVRQRRVAAEREQVGSMSANVTAMKTAKTASSTITISDCARSTTREPTRLIASIPSHDR